MSCQKNKRQELQMAILGQGAHNELKPLPRLKIAKLLSQKCYLLPPDKVLSKRRQRSLR